MHIALIITLIVAGSIILSLFFKNGRLLWLAVLEVIGEAIAAIFEVISSIFD